MVPCTILKAFFVSMHTRNARCCMQKEDLGVHITIIYGCASLMVYALVAGKKKLHMHLSIQKSGLLYIFYILTYAWKYKCKVVFPGRKNDLVVKALTVKLGKLKPIAGSATLCSHPWAIYLISLFLSVMDISCYSLEL